MSVIRVGFVLEQLGWLGGINYFRNLFTAIKMLPDAKIQPVVFVGLKTDVTAFDGLAEVIRSPILDKKSPSWWARKFLSKGFPKRDYLLYRLLNQNKIGLVSHFGQLWRGCAIPTMQWIPDFQHLHLPQFFNAHEVAIRDAHFLQIIQKSDAVILSSQDALNDLNKFSPDNTTPTHILRFVPCIDLTQHTVSQSELKLRYKLNRPWFHIPNQFWAHKNHSVVIEALHILKQTGSCPLVITTGNTSDHRNLEYFPSLMKRVNDYGLQDDFQTLGVLPYSDVVALMKYSVAIINPSLFEGWSTSVEEAKAIGKKIILSDISVHREQAPEQGYYFDPHNPYVLAQQMAMLMQQFDSAQDESNQRKVQLAQKERLENYARNFEQVVLRVAGKEHAKV